MRRAARAGGRRRLALPAVPPAARPTRDRPIAVFDSGVGGLTVLHELLVLAARRGLPLPRRHRALPVRRAQRRRSSRRFCAARSPRSCCAAGAKLLVVACNSATAAALPALRARMLQTTLGVDVLGVVRPRPCRRSTATRNGRIGLLATPATVASGAYAEAVAAADPHVELDRASPARTSRRSSRAASRSTSASSTRSAATCAPLREADVDTVILGCTHYPLVAPDAPADARPRRRRSSPRARRSRARSSTRSRARDLATPARGEGDYRFLCTGDVEAFRALGTRFLQMPLGEVEHVELAPLTRRAAHERTRPTRSYGRAADELRPIDDRARLRAHRDRARR